MAKWSEFLKQPYPFNDDFKQNTRMIFAISLILLLLLFLFQPFDIRVLDSREKYALLGGLIVVIFLGLSINLLFIPAFLSGTHLFKNWTVLKEILWNIWIIFTIASGYFIYFQLIGHFNFSFFILIKVLIISAIPVSILIPYNRTRLLKMHLHSALELNKYLKEKTNPPPRIIHLQSDYEKDNLSVDANELLFIRSANNYVEVFWQDQKGTHSQMVRCTLKCAEEACNDYPFIFKCHRAFIVNIHQIRRLEGNSQGYVIYVGDEQRQVSVSRKYIPAFKELFYKS
jgi:hypothetical protein